LGQINQGLKQFVVGLDAYARHPAADAIAALFGREHHAVIAQAVLVIGSGDGDLGRAQAAMAAGHGATAHPSYLEGDDAIGQQGDNPTDGPDEARTALAGPVHGLGEVEPEDHAGEGLGQEIDSVAARHLLQVGVVLALGRGLHLQVRDRDALLAGESGDRLRGRVAAWKRERTRIVIASPLAMEVTASPRALRISALRISLVPSPWRKLPRMR